MPDQTLSGRPSKPPAAPAPTPGTAGQVTAAQEVGARERAARVATARAAAARAAAARRPAGRPVPTRKGWGKREFKIGVDVLLLGAMVLAMVSSWHIASMALPFEFLPPPRNTWRDLHVTATAWCFVLMAFHLGLHLHNTITKWARKLTEKRTLLWGFKLLQVALLLWAGWSLWHNNVGHDLLMLPVRPAAFNAVAFYLEHLAIIAGFAVLTHGLLTAITPKRPRAK